MSKPPHLYAAWLVQQRLGEGIAINALTRDINRANEQAGTGCRVNRKLIQKLADGSLKLGLTTHIFIALDTYFRRLGRSLLQAPTLVCPGVIDALVQRSSVCFLYGARPRPKERRVDVSGWDLEAGAAVQTPASRANATCALDTKRVLWLTPASLQSVRSEEWFRVVDDDQASVVSLGSPLASLSSEVMLARMFGVPTPFESPSADAARALPFCFCWAPKVTGRLRSAFAITPEELRHFHPELATRVRANRAYALLFDGKVHEVPRTGGVWVMHGILAVQRRANGNVWMVVAGITGPATCAAARMVAQLQTILPWSLHQPSDVLWVPVRATVKEGKHSPRRGDIRELGKIEFAADPVFWPSRR